MKKNPIRRRKRGMAASFSHGFNEAMTLVRDERKGIPLDVRMLAGGQTINR